MTIKRLKKVELRLALIAVFLTGWLAALYTVHAQAPDPHLAVFLHVYPSPQQQATNPDTISPRHKVGDNLLSLQANSGQSRTDEKHHKRTIVTPAIIADFSVPPPQFFYCDVAYALFLPGGCCRKPAEDFSLRGPPSFC